MPNLPGNGKTKLAIKITIWITAITAIGGVLGKVGKTYSEVLHFQEDVANLKKQMNSENKVSFVIDSLTFRRIIKVENDEDELRASIYELRSMIKEHGIHNKYDLQEIHTELDIIDARLAKARIR